MWLKDVLLVNVPTQNWDFYEKSIYLGLMVRRLLLAEQKIVTADDRDYYGNKRMQLAGDMISLLFEEHFKNFNDDLKRTLEKKKDKTRTRALDILSEMNGLQNRITIGMESAISSGNWNLKRFKMDRKGITEVLCRLSYISALGMMTRIKSHFEKTRKVSGPRALQDCFKKLSSNIFDTYFWMHFETDQRDLNGGCYVHRILRKVNNVVW